MQSLNALAPMLCMLSGKVASASEEHLVNAVAPMLVKLSPNSMLDSPMQPRNAKFPMSVTLPGIVTLIRALLPENAYTPMLVTAYPISMSLMLPMSGNEELVNSPSTSASCHSSLPAYFHLVFLSGPLSALIWQLNLVYATSKPLSSPCSIVVGQYCPQIGDNGEARTSVALVTASNAVIGSLEALSVLFTIGFSTTWIVKSLRSQTWSCPW